MIKEFDYIQLKQILKNYPYRKSVVETTLARVEVWKGIINNPERAEGLEESNSIEAGMPRARNNTSPVEMALIKREHKVQDLKEWISDDLSRIYPYQIEIEQIEMAIACLNENERFIIEKFHFERQTWDIVEIQYSERFTYSLTKEGIRKLNGKAMQKLIKILSPFYSKVGRFN